MNILVRVAVPLALADDGVYEWLKDGCAIVLEAGVHSPRASAYAGERVELWGVCWWHPRSHECGLLDVVDLTGQTARAEWEQLADALSALPVDKVREAALSWMKGRGCSRSWSWVIRETQSDG